jgi:formate dehydrogenase subunit delta
VEGKPPVVRLANDIARQFEHKPHDVAVDAVARHINSFWDPRMRNELISIADAHRGDLHAVALDAVSHVRAA